MELNCLARLTLSRERTPVYIYQNSTKFHTSAVYISFKIVTMLFAVWVVNYEVMDLKKRHKCNRPYYLHTQFVMWEHE